MTAAYKKPIKFLTIENINVSPESYFHVNHYEVAIYKHCKHIAYLPFKYKDGSPIIACYIK